MRGARVWAAAMLEAGKKPLDGLHVLVAEDDHIQCDGIVGCITDFGATVVGPAHSLSEARQLVTSHSIDIAVVDIDLGDGDTFDFAHPAIERPAVHFFATGYNCRTVPADFGAHKVPGEALYRTGPGWFAGRSR